MAALISTPVRTRRTRSRASILAGLLLTFGCAMALNGCTLPGGNATSCHGFAQCQPVIDQAAFSAGANAQLMINIAWAESCDNSDANNGSHFGLYQYSTATYDGEVAQVAPYAYGTTPFNSAASSYVTAEVLNHGGLGNWAASAHGGCDGHGWADGYNAPW